MIVQLLNAFNHYQRLMTVKPFNAKEVLMQSIQHTSIKSGSNHIGADIHLAANLLRQGNLVAIPTETVYGLAADARNPSALAKVFQAKGRPSTNPLIIHLSSRIAITDWAINIPREAYQLAECFWPGPLTLILSRHPAVPKIATANQETVALRVPNHPLALDLLHEFGSGLAAPSANRSGRISPTCAAHVQEELGPSIDYILDGGPCEIGIESTIVYLAERDGKCEPLILRQGAIKPHEIAMVLGNHRLTTIDGSDYKTLSAESITAIQTPGSDVSHYAPLKPLYLLSTTELLERLKLMLSLNKKIGLLCFNETIQGFSIAHGLCLQVKRDPIQYAKHLYAHLRRLDQADFECILVEKPPENEEWLAIQDRLHRAASKKV